jgi:poly(A) polymerase
MPQSIWARQIEVVRSLLEAYWENTDEIISPPIFVTGHDLITEFSLQPGPVIGKLLEQIREAGAAGLIHDRLQALSLARLILEGAQYPEVEE